MADIDLDIRKSVEENAAAYFEKAKRSKKKLEGVRRIVEEAETKMGKLEVQEAKEIIAADEEREKASAKERRKAEWYEKYHWFISSEGFLCIGGRDATTNEIVIKKHTDSDDVIFHTDMPGSPFFVIKTGSVEGKKPGKSTLAEVAQATASYSKAWKLGVGSADVFWVKPEQVSKEAMSGEFIAKGAFMVYGKKNVMRADLSISVGITKEGRIMGAPGEAVKVNCISHVEIVQGDEKTSDTAKKIQKLIGGDLDEIIRALPAGGCKLKNKKR